MQLWTESHSPLWLEGKASQAQLTHMLHQLVRKIGQAIVRLKDFLTERNKMLYFRRPLSPVPGLRSIWTSCPAEKILQSDKGLARAQRTGATCGLDPATKRTASDGKTSSRSDNVDNH